MATTEAEEEVVGPPVPYEIEPGRPWRKKFLTVFFSVLFAVTTCAILGLIFSVAFKFATLDDKVLYTLIGATITQTGAMIGVIITSTFKREPE